ncbi:DUF5675 family protein [Apibacter adventoris]|uniref:DUF5675 family protein n=1 Tax=Apibacter adventoris TaxID=1679466 RepID=UPI000CF73682|nr:DUF5675 family protein [Apibacter adventoris]PQL95196.1 hypothetical protein C4S76_03145 [Apibacter adventoris]
MKAILTRRKFDKVQTLGDLALYNDSEIKIFQCKTLELPWKNNRKSISCIPVGIYEAVPRTTPQRGKHYHIVPTEPRQWILIHAGNFYTDIKGCILIGDSYSDINKDGYLDILNSRITLKKLIELAPKGFTIEIK